MEVPCSGRVILNHVKDPSSLLNRCRLEPNSPNIGQFAVPAAGLIVKHDWWSMHKIKHVLRYSRDTLFAHVFHRMLYFLICSKEYMYFISSCVPANNLFPHVFQRILYFLKCSREYFISSCVPENTLFLHMFQRIIYFLMCSREYFISSSVPKNTLLPYVFQRMLYFRLCSKEYFISSCVPKNNLFPHVFHRILYFLMYSREYCISSCVPENTQNSKLNALKAFYWAMYTLRDSKIFLNYIWTLNIFELCFREYCW